MARILIPNCYTWYEKGDAAIVVGMVQALRRYLPGASITILSFTPRIDAEKYEKYDLTVLGSLLPWSPADPSPRLLKALRLMTKAAKYALWTKMRVPIGAAAQQVLDAYANADIVVSKGGGYLGGRSFTDGLGTFLHLYEIYFARLLRKKIVLYGQSIEPISHPLIRWATKFVLNRTDLITVREPISEEYLKSLSIKPKVILTSDASFLVKGIPGEEARRLLAAEDVKGSQRPLVGMTVRRWHFPGYKDGKARLSNYIAVMAATIDWLTENMNATVVLFPQVIWSPKDDDRTISNEVLQKVREKAKAKVLTKDYSPEELKGMIGQMDLFIGTRMHSNIFALSQLVPTIAISYQEKARGIMGMLGMGQYVLDLASLRLDDMLRLIEEVSKSREDIRRLLEPRIKEAENQAWHNAKLVAEMLHAQH